jgi:hypothetical protein
MSINFLMNKFCRTYFSLKKKQFPAKSKPKLYLSQDPDPEVLSSRIQIQTKIIQINI